MAEHIQEFYRGIIVHDPAFNADNMTITPDTAQASPVPGRPVTQAGSEGYLDLEAVGTSTAGKKYEVRAVRAGNGWGEPRGGRSAWRDQGDPDTDWRGWDPYSVVTDCEMFIDPTNPTVPTATIWNPHAITTAANFVHCVYHHHYEDTSTVPTTVGENVSVRTLNPATDTWTTAHLLSRSYTGSLNNIWGATSILELPSGRLLVFICGIDGAGIDTYYSDDSGATWAIRSAADKDPQKKLDAADLGAPVTGRVRSFQVVEHNGYLTAIVGATKTETWPVFGDHQCRHFASDDWGASWTLIEEFDGPAASPSATRVAAWCFDPRLHVDANGSVLLLYSDNSESLGRICFSWKPSPFARFSDHLSFGTGLSDPRDQSAILKSWGFASCIDPEGFLCVTRSGDMNGTNNDLGQTSTIRYRLSDLPNKLDDHRTNFNGFYHAADHTFSDHQYRLLGHHAEVNHSTLTPYKEGLLLITAGGKSQYGYNNQDDYRHRVAGWQIILTLGGYSNFDHYTGTATWPLDTPRYGFSFLPTFDGTEYAAGVTDFVTAPAPYTDSVTPDGLTIETPAAQYGGFGQDPNSRSIWAKVKVESVATIDPGTGDITGNHVSLISGALEVRLSATHAQVWNQTTAAALNTTLQFPNVEFREWRITRGDGNIHYVLYREPGGLWIKWLTGALVAPGAFFPGTIWGHWIASTVPLLSHWRFVHHYPLNPMDPENNWSLSAYAPAGLHGRPLSAYPLYLDDGWSLKAKGSAAFFSDSWKAETEYEYSVRNVNPEISASPRSEWRSDNDLSSITIDWEPAPGTLHRPNSEAAGLHLTGANFKTYTVSSYYGGLWHAVHTVDPQDFSGCRYNLSGDTLIPDILGADFTASRFIKADELVGSYAKMTDAGTGQVWVRPIVNNSAGTFAHQPGTFVRPMFTIGGDLSGISASGNFDVIQHQTSSVFRGGQLNGEKLRITIPIQDTAEGYFKIGAFTFGSVFFFGQDYSWGKAITHTPNVELTTARGGERMAEALGPIRRTVEFAWADGWESSPIGGDPIAPNNYEYDHITAGLLEFVGIRQDPHVVSAALGRANGSANPVVFLPRIPHQPTTDHFTITGRDRQLYGRIVSPVKTQTVLGEEDNTEMITINAVVIDEEV